MITQEISTSNEQLDKLNPSQRKALRKKFSGRKIAYVICTTWNELLNDGDNAVYKIVVIFNLTDGRQVQHSGMIGRRGCLKDVELVGVV